MEYCMNFNVKIMQLDDLIKCCNTVTLSLCQCFLDFQNLRVLDKANQLHIAFQNSFVFWKHQMNR